MEILIKYLDSLIGLPYFCEKLFSSFLEKQINLQNMAYKCLNVWIHWLSIFSMCIYEPLTGYNRKQQQHRPCKFFLHSTNPMKHYSFIGRLTSPGPGASHDIANCDEYVAWEPSLIRKSSE